MLLVGAFALAVIFVALALVVNSAIYSENLATRGTVPGSNDAIEQRHQVEQSVGTAIEYVNEHNYSSLGDIEGNIHNLSHDLNRQQLLVSRAIDVSYVDRNEGHRIVQRNDSNRAFTNETGVPDWVLANDVDQIRAFTINVTDTSLLNSVSPFTVVANQSGTTWKMSVEENVGGMTVVVENSNGISESCDRTTTNSNSTIDVTGGLVAGKPCAALTKLTDTGENMSIASGLSGSYDIEFENGNNIVGNYSMVIDSTSANGDSLNSSPTGDAPFYTAAIYSVTVEYAYRTTDVAYDTEIDVAPGEPR